MSQTNQSTTTERFEGLHGIAGFIEFCGWAIAVLAVIFTLYVLGQIEPYSDRTALITVAASSFLGGSASALLFVGIGKTLKLLLAIEENTRDT